MRHAEEALAAYYDSMRCETSVARAQQVQSIGFMREAVVGVALGAVLALFLANSATELPKGFVPPQMITQEQNVALFGDVPRRPVERASRVSLTWPV